MRNLNQLVVITFFILALVGCKTENINNFLINGKDIAENTIKPRKSTEYITIDAGDIVTFSNLNLPTDKNIQWDMNGDGDWDTDFEGKKNFKTAIDVVGMIKISMKIEGDKKISKWLKVEGEEVEKVVLEDPILPSVEFLNPTSIVHNTNKKKFQIEALMNNFYEDDIIKLFVREDSLSFEIDPESNILTKEITLKKGDNDIKIEANVDGEFIYKLVTINYDPNRKMDDLLASREDLIKRDSPVNVPKKKIKKKNEAEKEKEVIYIYDDPIDEPVYEPKKEIVEEIIVEKEVVDVEEKEVEVDLNIGNSFGSTGFKTSDYNASCAQEMPNSYSFTITPTQPVELSEFTIYTNNCGGIMVSVKYPGGTESIETVLTKGSNQILLTDLYLTLIPGVTYTVTCTTFKGYGCSASTKPAIFNYSSCAMSQKYSSQMKSSFNGKSVIFNLKYQY